MAPEAGHDPATFGLTDRRYYQLSYSGTKLVAGPGIEPGTKAYETCMIPFQYPATEIYGAGGENRTPNLLITNQLPYHWATPA